MIFDITSFFIVTPLSPDVALPYLDYQILQILQGDTITGVLAMSDPLPPEPPTESTGYALLEWPENPTPASPYLSATDVNVGGGPGGTDTNSVAPWGWVSTLDPVVVELVVPKLAPVGELIAEIKPDSIEGGGSSSYIVKVDLTIDNPDRTEPPPLLSEKSKQALEQVTEQLDKLSRGFDLLNVPASGAVKATGLKVANWGISNAVTAIDPKVGFANAVQQAALSVEDTVAEAITEPNPVAIILGGVSVIYALTGLVTGAMALDPPDGDFTTVFQPVNESFSVSGATAVDNALLSDSISFLDDNLMMLVASERYQGAILAGDTVGAALQSTAYDTAQTNSLTDAATVSSDLTNFSSELTSQGFQDGSYDGSSLAATQTYLNTAGTSDLFLTNLANRFGDVVGTAAAQATIQAVITDIEGETAPVIPGTVFGFISSTETTLNDYANGTLACFLKGTSINTALGELPVECLRTSHRLNVCLGTAEAPIEWIGRRDINTRRHRDPTACWPIRVSAGAFGPDQPYRDLFLSPEHAIYVMGVLIPVKHLLNGSTIVQTPMDDVTYYHVALPRHDVLLANGLPVESYLRTGDRSNFVNDRDVVRLFPDFSATSVKHHAFWEADGCAPLVVSGPVLDTARAHVNARAAANSVRARDDDRRYRQNRGQHAEA